MVKPRKTRPPSFPASDWVRQIKDELAKKDAVKLLAVLLLTNGSLYKVGNAWVGKLSNKARVMHDIFFRLGLHRLWQRAFGLFHRNLVSNIAGKGARDLVSGFLRLSPTHAMGANFTERQPDLGFSLDSSQRL